MKMPNRSKGEMMGCGGKAAALCIVESGTAGRSSSAFEITDGHVEKAIRLHPTTVIPAKAGIQCFGEISSTGSPPSRG
jgi:hypothetical protein